MDRQRMIDAITEYAGRHGQTYEELRCFVADVTGSFVESAADEADLLSRLSPGELEAVHEVVLGHNDFESQRAS